MVVELINTGSELLLGLVLNTHQQWLCRRLADLGYDVDRQVAVPDTAAAIQQSVREALGRADLLITTGGLGPTSDDRTRELIAGLLGRELREDAASVAAIKAFFARGQRVMVERNLVQALVPEGALVLPNPHGTAPGLAIEVPAADGSWKRDLGTAPEPASAAPHPSSSKWLIMLPGPPRELRPMFLESVVPLLRRVFPPDLPTVSCTLRTTGIGESAAQEKIEAGLEGLVRSGLELGYCARPGQVDVRVLARGSGAHDMVREAERIVRTELGSAIFGAGEDELEPIVLRLLTEKKQTLAVAESCTGGGIADRLTNVPGASAAFLGGFVTYSNRMKETLLGVRTETLSQHGAVSEAVAREMAAGAQRAAGSDYAIAVTGIAGPEGGTPEKPVGTVFMALTGPMETEAWKLFNPWDRLTFKEVTARQAINFLRLRLLK